ncbi:DUF5641 domain-containing protein [Trichonephila clavipes]|nr:DUF5641 domain-containing protein [Trichonephila clavipes]
MVWWEDGSQHQYISDDPNEMTAITPDNFIQDIRGAEKGYLGELVCNPRSRSKGKEICIGEIVLIGSDNSKRLNWPLGRVIELYPGIKRVAKLRVANGFVIRHMQTLYPLEMPVYNLPSDIAFK